MKKSSLILSLGTVFALSLSSCGNSNNNVAPANNSETIATNIRFYDPDSVAKNYALIEVLNEQMRVEVEKYQSEERKKANEIQRLGQQIQDKMKNNGYLSEASYNKDMENFQKKQQQAQVYLAELQNQINQKTLEQTLMLQDTLKNFLSDYNKGHNFDAILQNQPGNYVNPALDITGDIIEGLNTRYQASLDKEESKAETK